MWPHPLTYLRLPGLQVREGVASFHSHPVGDRLRHFLPMWGSFTTDQWVLDIVRQGYPLPFVTMPQLTLTPLQTLLRTTPVRRTVLRQEFQALLDTHAVRVVARSLAPQKGGSWRPILNVKRLNVYIRCDRCHMVPLANILKLSRQWIT